MIRMIQIKRNNEVFYTIEDVCEGSKLSRQLMDHHYVILKFSTEKPVYFEIGDSVEIPGFGYFELTSAYFPKYNDSTDGYDYELQMDAYYMAWKNKICKYRPQYGANETSFKLTTSVAVHLNVILGNLKALGYKYNGLDFAVDYTTYNKGAFDVDKRFYIEYGSISILDAINAICDENALDCEWWVDGNIIYLGYCEMTGQVTFEQGVNMLSMSYSESKSSYITRLYAFGSDKNIPTGYFTGSDADVTTDGIATDYLMLPNKEVDSDGFYSKDGYLENTNVVKNEKQAIEGVVMFDNEYPKVECTVSGIKTYDSTVEENGEKKTQTFWQVTSKDSFATNFTKSWIKRNLTLMIKFTSGALMGMEFDVEYKIIEHVNYFEIVANETYGRSLPDGVMCPKEGDTFFLYNWDATKITETNLIQEAQDALYERAKVYYLKSMIDNSNFTCVLDAVKFYNHGVYNYHPLGEQVKLINPMFSDVDANGKHYRNSRIIGMDIKLDIPYDEPTYIVGEKAASSRLSKLEDKVTSITVNGIQIGGTGSGGGGVYVIGLNDSTPATDSNVYSARRVDQNYANKYREEYIREIYTFAKGLISDMLAKLKGGATFGTGGYKFDEEGNVVVDALSSLAFDEALERGFGISKNAHGKYTLSVTDLMVWGKAVFNSLEIRKLYAVGGNVYLSGASSKIVRAVPVKKATAAASSTGENASAAWVACAEGDADCEGWKCYTLNDDGTTATQNGWRKYDQAKCQTFDIEAGAHEGVSNTFYWRLVADVSTKNETITETRTETYVDADGVTKTREVTVDLYDGKKFGWVVLSKTDCESATNDAPKAGDTIVLDGHRMFASGYADGRDQYNDESRTNVMMLETTGVSDGSLPRIVALTGITDYRHSDGKNEYSNTVFILSPKEVVFVSSSFKFMSASGDPITFVNFRGSWATGTEYAYYDQVSHNNAIWTCIVEKGTTTTDEPSDTSAAWRKEISGGKGEKGDKGDPGTPGKDAVTYGVQVTPTYEVWSDAKKHAGIVLTFTKTTGSTMLKYLIVKTLGTVKVCADGTEIEGASKWINDGNNKIIFDSFTFDGTNNTPTIGTASVISIELIVDDKIVATANYANGKQGDGVVMAYKHADTQPDAPTGTDPEYPGAGWSLSPDAATAGEKVTDVRYGGYESGTYDGNNKGTDATAKEWAEAEDDGRTWMKSPSGLSYNYGYAMMKVSFITQYDNTTVDVEIKAYSEQNYDLVEVWALDTAPSTGTSFRGQGLAHASGNGVEQAYSFTVAKAGRHFICVTYAKDISGDDNGDYGLFRLALSDNEVAVSDTVWMSQAKVSGGKCVLPWSTPVKINGADGIGAFEILCDPETIVIDTDDNGLATGLDNAYASLMCLRDGKEVSGVTYKKGSCVNCEATVNTDTGVVAITRVDKQSVTVDGQTVEVSCTSGSVTVSVTDPTTKTTYVKTIPFSVNVAKFNGGLKADNKTLKSQYTELSKNSATKDDLKQYDSKIEQTARNIKFEVMEKSVGRRNLLPGSAFRKQGEGCSIVQDGQDAINGICINGGYDGVNCARLRNEGNAGAAFPRVSWDGGRNSNVKVAKGKKYTLSFWAKRLSSTEGGYEISTQFFLQDGANGYARPYGALKFGSFTVKSQGEWEFIQDTVTIPSEAKSNYMEVCICLGLLQRGMAEILVCRPMLEEGEEYNGWTLSEQDYDYVGGNLLDGTATLAKTGNVEVLDGTVTQGGMGESASILASPWSSPTAQYVDFLQYSTSGMGLKANEDYVLSFYAKTEGNAGKLQCYLYPSEGYTNTEDSEGGYDYYNPSDGSLQSAIVPGTTWKRYWVHWRPTKADPKHVLFRLLRDGNDRGTYSSYTTYAVDDVVLYDGTYYRCIKAGQGNTPSSSSSYWEATYYEISLSQPKLEVGAMMTEWTAKRADMVDKQALYATGINIDSKEITLTASNTKFRDNDGKEMAVIDHDGLRATKIATTDNGGGHTEISGNTTVWFQKDGVTPGIAVFYDAAGVPHLAFYGTDGKQKYDIGPSGLQSLISSIQQAHSDTAYLRLATSAVKDYNSALSFDWLYVAKGQQADLRYIWRKQIPTTDASKNYDIYDGCVFTKNYYNTTNSVSWPNPNFLLPNGWYTEPNDGNLPMKLHMVDNEGVLDPMQTVYYQTFYYYEGGKVARMVRAYMKRTTSSQLVSKFTYAGSYDEI